MQNEKYTFPLIKLITLSLSTRVEVELGCENFIQSGCFAEGCFLGRKWPWSSLFCLLPLDWQQQPHTNNPQILHTQSFSQDVDRLIIWLTQHIKQFFLSDSPLFLSWLVCAFVCIIPTIQNKLRQFKTNSGGLLSVTPTKK